jgi:hypothetical protein
MKKGLLILFLVTLATAVFAQSPKTTITAVKKGDLYDVTITWKPADDMWTEVELRGNYQGDLWGKGKPMTKNADGSWTITITGLAEGTYEYKFYANDTWMDEADNYPATVGNPFGGVNGSLIVNEALTRGEITKPWAPTVNLNLNLQWNFKWEEEANQPPPPPPQQPPEYSAKARLKGAGYLKLHGEILPSLFIFTETFLHGNGGGDNYLTYNENWNEKKQNEANLRSLSFLVRGYSIISNHYAELQKFFIEYRTPFVDISYSDGYYKWVPESYAGPFVFTMYSVDGAGDGNALMGTWRLLKQGLPIADGIKLDYMLSWGLNARRQWDTSKAIWNTNFPPGYGGSSWDDDKAGFLGSANYFQIVGGFGTIGLNVDLVSETPNADTGHDIDDFFTILNKQFSIGYKNNFGIANVAFQFATQIPNSLFYPNFEYSLGRNSVIGLKGTINTLGLEGLSLGLYVALVGADYNPERFYAVKDEDKAGDYVGSDVANKYVTFKVEPKFSAMGITAGLDYKLQVANPTNKSTDLSAASDGDIYNDFKVYGGFSTPDWWVDLYAKLKFNIYETTANKNAFEFNEAGLKVGMANLVPGVINDVNLYYAFFTAGQGSTNTSDDALGNSVLLTMNFATNTAFHVGLGFVSGEANSTIPDYKTNFGYGIGVQQAFPFMNTTNMTKYHVFVQYRHALNIFDGEDQGKVGLSDYKISGAQAGLYNIKDTVIVGVWFDY